ACHRPTGWAPSGGRARAEVPRRLRRRLSRRALLAALRPPRRSTRAAGERSVNHASGVRLCFGLGFGFCVRTSGEQGVPGAAAKRFPHEVVNVEHVAGHPVALVELAANLTPDPTVAIVRRRLELARCGEAR